MQPFPSALGTSSAVGFRGEGWRRWRRTKIKAFVTYQRRYENTSKLHDSNVFRKTAIYFPSI